MPHLGKAVCLCLIPKSGENLQLAEMNHPGAGGSCDPLQKKNFLLTVDAMHYDYHEIFNNRRSSTLVVIMPCLYTGAANWWVKMLQCDRTFKLISIRFGWRQAMHVKEFGTSFELAETAIMQEIESHLLPELQNSQFRLVAKRDKMNLYCQGGFFKAHQVGF